MKKIVAAITLIIMILCSVASAQRQRAQVSGYGRNLAYADREFSINARSLVGSANYRIISQRSYQLKDGTWVRTKVIEYGCR
jgi:hypothetical protein